MMMSRQGTFIRHMPHVKDRHTRGEFLEQALDSKRMLHRWKIPKAMNLLEDIKIKVMKASCLIKIRVLREKGQWVILSMNCQMTKNRRKVLLMTSKVPH